MQSDIVDFQPPGLAPNDHGGLCDVLPKNIWLYVSQIPNLAKLGKTFVLQGGTQHNLAAVKSQVDFISSRFRGMAEQPNIIVHKFCGEAGAIGCAVEAHRLYTESDVRTSFIGLERVQKIKFRTTRAESTRCYFCKNKCLRTFIDVKTGEETEAAAPAGGNGVLVSLTTQIIKIGPESGHPTRIKHGSAAEAAAENAPTTASKSKSKVPLEEGEQRLIIATCEKGTVEDVSDMRDQGGSRRREEGQPELRRDRRPRVLRPVEIDNVSDPLPKVTFANILKKKEIERRAALMKNRENVRIGMPRVLNMYSMGPWFMAYFQTLGIRAANLIWSDYTSEELYKEGAKRGDRPCFPARSASPRPQPALSQAQGKPSTTSSSP
jgi:hypothetical protein